MRNENRFHLTTDITRGDRHFRVSTVDLTVRHSGGQYETMVFATDAQGEVTNWRELMMDRYETEAEARAGHESVCASFQPDEAAAEQAV